MNSIAKFAAAWTWMWALTYIICGVVAPNLEGNAISGIVIYEGIGVLELIALALSLKGSRHWYSQVPLFAMALVEVFGGVASWTGVCVWNVPFSDKSLFPSEYGLCGSSKCRVHVILGFGGYWAEQKSRGR